MSNTTEMALTYARGVVERRRREAAEDEARYIARPLNDALQLIAQHRAQGAAWPAKLTYCIDYPSKDVDIVKMHLPEMGYRVETTYSDGDWINGRGHQRMCTHSVWPK